MVVGRRSWVQVVGRGVGVGVGVSNITNSELIAVFLILVLCGTFFEDLKRLLTLRSFWCKIIFCELIKTLTHT